MSSLVIQKSAEVVESRHFGLLVQTRIFQSGSIDFGASSIDLPVRITPKIDYQNILQPQSNLIRSTSLIQSGSQWISGRVQIIVLTMLSAVKQFFVIYNVIDILGPVIV